MSWRAPLAKEGTNIPAAVLRSRFATRQDAGSRYTLLERYAFEAAESLDCRLAAHLAGSLFQSVSSFDAVHRRNVWQLRR
jgi:hypothetical protein